MRGRRRPLLPSLTLALFASAAVALPARAAPTAPSSVAPAPSPAPTKPPALPPPPTPKTDEKKADEKKPSATEKSAEKPAEKAGEKPADPKPSEPKPAASATPKPSAKPAPAKPTPIAHKAPDVKKGAPGKAAPVKTSRTQRIPDAAMRRQIAGGPTQDDAATGAESPELAALREAERELFPASSSGTDPFVVDPPTSGDAARPRVQATGLPRMSTRTVVGSEGGKDLSWMSSLVLPELPIRWEPRLVRYLEFFKNDPRGRATLSLWLRRSGRYAEGMRKVLRKKGVPEDLMWLSMIESGFDPTIRSPAGAVGLWQFMPESGRQYGLHQDRWLDQRMNVQNATEAAAEFLSDLHKRFGSWELAMAAYNMGYGGLLVVVRKYNTNDYWTLSELEGALPWETTLYVPKILAAAIVARNPGKFGFADLTAEPYVETEEVFVPPATPLATVAKAAGLAPKEVESLNPELRAARTPPAEADDPKGVTFAVKVPSGKAQAVLANLQKVKREERPLERYVVRFGESLDSIATARGTTTGKLAELNAIGQGEVVRGGTVLLVPRAEGASAATDAAATGAASSTADKPIVVVPQDIFVYPDKKRVFYRVTAGDSLRDVAAAFGVSVDEIRRWNALDPQGRLHEGMTLQLFVREDADLSKVVALSQDDVRVLIVGSEEFLTYFEAQKGRKRLVLTAKPGDTLESIGKRYGLSVASMERINRRGRGEALREGDRVVVYATEHGPGATATATSAAKAKGDASSDVEARAPSGIPGATGPEPLGPLPTPPAPDRLPRAQ